MFRQWIRLCKTIAPLPDQNTSQTHLRLDSPVTSSSPATIQYSTASVSSVSFRAERTDRPFISPRWGTFTTLRLVKYSQLTMRRHFVCTPLAQVGIVPRSHSGSTIDMGCCGCSLHLVTAAVPDLAENRMPSPQEGSSFETVTAIDSRSQRNSSASNSRPHVSEDDSNQNQRENTSRTLTLVSAFDGRHAQRCPFGIIRARSEGLDLLRNPGFFVTFGRMICL